MKEAVGPVNASTVMVLREAKAGLEVYCLRRNPELRAWGGATAFPGGKIEASDCGEVYERVGTPPHPRVAAFGESVVAARAAVVAGVRECFEEACLLPTVGPCGQGRVASLRERWRAGEELGPMLEKAGLTVDLGALVPVARWVTPALQRIRFDARFYVMALPRGQVGIPDEDESLEGQWFCPLEILEKYGRREVELVPPTQWMLHMLSKYKSIAEVEAFAEQQTLRSIVPELRTNKQETRLVLPGDPDHSQAMRCLEGPTSYTLCGDRFALNVKR